MRTNQAHRDILAPDIFTLLTLSITTYGIRNAFELDEFPTRPLE